MGLCRNKKIKIIFMSKVIEYDLICAQKNGVIEHPEKDIETLGMKIITYAGKRDCVWAEVENIPDKLPEYISLTDYVFVYK